MNLLLHTIALEPARWTPEKVSRPLIELLPEIARTGFKRLEIFEPHLKGVESEKIKDALQGAGLVPVTLSSYIDLRLEAAEQTELLIRRVKEFGFQKVRLFPSGNSADSEAIKAFLNHLKELASILPNTELLLETHDGSLADDPHLIAQIVADLALPNVGLLYQPTFFTADTALSQWEIQRPFIRHLHLQNRWADLSFAPLSEGVIPWENLLKKMNFSVDATLEFVPMGICSPSEFDLTATLRQICSERDYLEKIEQEYLK